MPTKSIGEPSSVPERALPRVEAELMVSGLLCRFQCVLPALQRISPVLKLGTALEGIRRQPF
jgi:hypothetical protein